MKWEWKEGSVLNNYNENTPCKEIFRAICDEIAEYYIPKGWKYARSRPKITLKNTKIKFEIAFWSSGSNTPGEWVNLEIIPSFASIELKNHLKERGIDSYGYMRFPEFYQLSENIKKGEEHVIRILDKPIRRESRYDEKSGVLIHSNNVNVYGITTDDFEQIIEFIEINIVAWIKWADDYEKVKTFAQNSLSAYRERMVVGDFMHFVRFKFPEKENEILRILE
ncbi:hypothetical protein [Algibacter mikhailovii]|uniref:DUF4304 domain-containing protein n=1 Tax=Algibacter mikhailovii TaxID=425498 RepID=A0A918V527_9FLAO|nr:hypothetical protein [Algibacter mikhailovii]GGZ69681.1 hypothetical protein GCM10007028_03430 [Algibacter mikhailovii]